MSDARRRTTATTKMTILFVYARAIIRFSSDVFMIFYFRIVRRSLSRRTKAHLEAERIAYHASNLCDAFQLILTHNQFKCLHTRCYFQARLEFCFFFLFIFFLVQFFDTSLLRTRCFWFSICNIFIVDYDSEILNWFLLGQRFSYSNVTYAFTRIDLSTK